MRAKVGESTHLTTLRNACENPFSQSNVNTPLACSSGLVFLLVDSSQLEQRWFFCNSWALCSDSPLSQELQLIIHHSSISGGSRIFR
jgi:hypothetical protein